MIEIELAGYAQPLPMLGCTVTGPGDLASIMGNRRAFPLELSSWWPIAVGASLVLTTVPAHNLLRVRLEESARLSLPGPSSVKHSAQLPVVRGRPKERASLHELEGGHDGEGVAVSDPSSRWVDVGLIGAVEMRADFAWADLSDADLRWSHFFRPDFSATLLIGANLSGASFLDARFDGAVLVDAEVHAAQLKGARMQRADLSWANMSSATLAGASLVEAVLHGADLRSTNFTSADLEDADLSGTDLRKSFLVAASLRGAMLQGADLRFANLTDADLRGANLSGANFEDAELTAAVVDRQQLQAACGNERTRLPVHLHGFALRICD
ncbi:MAG: pentapeptide repeat-containing protein [Gammaproteobacteria bacterium]